MAVVKAKDPVPILRARLIAEGTTSEDDLTVIEAAIAGDIEAAVVDPYAAQVPGLIEMKRDVYATGLA